MENVFEHLSKDRLLPLLRERMAELDSAMAVLSKRISRAPCGVLNVSPHRGRYQYYRMTAKTGRKGEFIPEEKMSVAAALAQRDYDKKMLAELQKQYAALERCLARYDVAPVENGFAALHLARRSLVAPLIYPDDDYVSRWNSVEYAGRRFEADAPMLMTARGERVRSKSELIIADALFRRGIPYRYEFPHKLRLVGIGGVGRGRVVVYPDFTCLNVRTRQEFVWEHFGLIDVPEYCQNMASKMEMYLQNGFCVGKNFLMTTETRERPLNSMMVEAMLEWLV